MFRFLNENMYVRVYCTFSNEDISDVLSANFLNIIEFIKTPYSLRNC